MKDIDSMTIEDLRAWYKRWYRPGNAVLVIVGDVKAASVFKLAQHYFGNLNVLKAGKDEFQKPGPWQPPAGTRHVVVKAPAKLPFLIMGFDVPVFTSSAWQPYALALASAALDGGESARFSKNLIRGKSVAAGASTHYELFKRYASQFDISGIPKEGISIETLQSGLWEEVQALKSYVLSEKELKKIKAQLLASEIFQKDSMSEQATNLGEYEAINLSWKDAEAFMGKINQITPEQIQQVAQQYFTQERLTVAILKPQAIP